MLLELPKWIQPGTFKAKATNEEEDLVGRDWILENLVVEVFQSLKNIWKTLSLI